MIVAVAVMAFASKASANEYNEKYFTIDTDGNVGGLFTEGNPGLGQPATVVGASWLNDTVQEELVNVVLSEGLTLNKASNTQLLQALSLKIGAATGLMMQSDTPISWDGANIEFNDDIKISYRSGDGTFFTSLMSSTLPNKG